MGRRCLPLVLGLVLIGCGARDGEAETVETEGEAETAHADQAPEAVEPDEEEVEPVAPLPLLRGHLDEDRLVLTEGSVEARLSGERVVGAVQVVPLTVDRSRLAVFVVDTRPRLLAELTDAGEVRVLWRRDPARQWYLAVRLVDLDEDGTYELVEQWMTPRRPRQPDHGSGGGVYRPRVLRLRDEGYEESARLRARAPSNGVPFDHEARLTAQLPAGARLEHRSDVASSRTVTGIRSRMDGIAYYGGMHGPGDVQVGDVVAYFVLIPGEEGRLLGEARLVVARGGSVLGTVTLGTRDMRHHGEGCGGGFTGGEVVLTQDWDTDGTRAIVAIWNASPEGTVARVVRWDGTRLGPMTEPVPFESCANAGVVPPRVIVTPARAQGVEPQITVAP